MTSKRIVRAAAMCIGVVLSASVWAQAERPVVDGDLWLKSSPEVRKAFLVGAASMVALETVYSKRRGLPAPAAGARAAKAMEGMTLDEVSERITRWYQTNPEQRKMPVMAALWVDMVDPGALKR